MAGLSTIKFVVTGVAKGTCPCCIGGEVAHVLGCTKDCLCGQFLKQLEKHQKGLPRYHTCLRDLPGRGRLHVYMLQPDVLHVELATFGFLSYVEATAIGELLRATGEHLTASSSEYGYTAEELGHPPEDPSDPYNSLPPYQHGLVTPEQDERLARALAEGPPWERAEELRPERSPRPIPPPLPGHR